MTGKLFRPLLVFILTLAFVGGSSHVARADLTITPVRVVFEGRDRSATVELINLTNRTNTYRLRWMEMKMGPSGRYELMPADESNPNSVSKMVIFTPRQVTIQPKGHQTIRLSLRRPADLPVGEYRAHLAMVRLAKQGPDLPENRKDVATSMQVNLGFSIPVIVRSGEDKDLKISLVSPKLDMNNDTPPRPQLSISVQRDAGKFSTYGTIRVLWRQSGKDEKEIGRMTNVALYPELDKRPLNIQLNENPTSGSIRVIYEGKYESDGKTWAEKILPIGK